MADDALRCSCVTFAVCLRRMSGKLASNQRFSTSVTQVWRLAGDGLVASMVAYYDTTSIAKAAGKAKKD